MVRVALAAALVVSVSAAHHPDVFGRAVNSTSATSASTLASASASSSTTASVPGTPTGTSSSSAPSSTGTITPVPAGVLPDNYFVQGVTPRTWSQALALAAKFVAPMTVEEKVSLTTGLGFGVTRCVGNIAELPKYKFPGLCLQDSPLGVRFADRVSAFAAGINAAATWDRDLIRARGVALGQEFKGKGVHVALGPMMNLGRVAAGGRNWEGFGADPYLSGEAAYETIIGMQSTGVQACAKHYINNEQEIKRDASSSDVDDRTQHEIYARPFLRSVAAGVASFMCSYNQVNGTYACENDKILNGILKTEYGFPGYVMSDWWATHSTESANRGLDMEMPGGTGYGIPATQSWLGGNLTSYVQTGRVSQARLTDMATRIIAAWYLVGQEKGYPAVNFDSRTIGSGPLNLHVDVQGDHYKGIREMGAASTVLLKNTKNALPLKKPISMAVIGSDAAPPLRGPNGFTDRAGVDGTLAMGWGSGTAEFPYLVSPIEALQARAQQDHTSIGWHFLNWDLAAAKTQAANKDVAIVFINSDSGEGYLTVDGNQGDRNNLTAWDNGDALVQAVASVNPNTVVVAHAVGPMIIEPWIDNPNVTAVLWAGLPGQESGNGLVDILYGAVNPSARLPYTIAKQRSDYGVDVFQYFDYRHFDKNNIVPRYAFGYGLSYTTFSYANLRVTKVANALYGGGDAAAWESGKVASSAVKGSSLAPWLHAPYYQVSFDLRNTGAVAGNEVPQLYIQAPASANSPPNQLRGFDRIALRPGQTQRVTLTVSRYDLSVWDVARQGWAKMNGQVGLTVGASSRDFKLKGVFA
ncbi:glycoside hydrolase family 3 protein [Ceratobasidium sp. AG-Ba]|nr:glycoside hydrolase family 3 protein [Ceratobasidium sp. AG-Ba]